METYLDVTSCSSDFQLPFGECRQALMKGNLEGRIDLPNCQNRIWGQVDLDKYQLYDHPDIAGLQVVVPKRFAAFRGPKDQMENAEQNENTQTTQAYYATPLKLLE